MPSLIVAGAAMFSIAACTSHRPTDAAPGDAARGDAAPSPPNCGTAITITMGPAVVVDTCTGELVNVPTCGGPSAKAVVVKFALPATPGTIYYLADSAALWLSRVSNDCLSVASVCPIEHLIDGSGYWLVQDPQGGCGTVSLKVDYRTGVSSEPVDGVDDDALLGLGHVVVER